MPQLFVTLTLLLFVCTVMAETTDDRNEHEWLLHVLPLPYEATIHSAVSIDPDSVNTVLTVEGKYLY